MKAFLKLDENTTICDYNVYFYNTSRTPQQDYFIINNSCARKEFLDTYIDKSFIPLKGSTITCIPPCKYAIDDVRKNYTIKRKLDEGVCNVINIDNNSFSYLCAYDTAVVNNTTKEIAFSFVEYTYNGPIFSVDTIVSNIMKNVSDDIRVFAKNSLRYRELCILNNDKLKDILSHNTTKPVITYEQLSLNSDIPLDIESLDIVFKLGKERYSSEAVSKLKIELMALNNQNWRKYPKTISYLIYGSGNQSYSAMSAITSCLSQNPKPIKEMLLAAKKCRYNNRYIASEDDYNMFKSLVLRTIGIKSDSDTLFVSLHSIANKSIDLGLSYGELEDMFGCVTRIKPVSYEAYRNSISKRN